MRTTITLTPEAQGLVERAMRDRDMSFKDVVNAAIIDGLRTPEAADPYVMPLLDLGGARVNMDRALALAGELEDEELMRRRQVGS